MHVILFKARPIKNTLHSTRHVQAKANFLEYRLNYHNVGKEESRSLLKALIIRWTRRCAKVREGAISLDNVNGIDHIYSSESGKFAARD